MVAEQDRNIGIYAIYNKINGKCYVGSSRNITKRFKKGHKPQLIKGIHTAYKLQRAWDKYGEKTFKLLLLQNCKIENLRKLEVLWIRKLNSFHKGYNSNDKGSGPNEETIKRIKEANLRPERIELARKTFTEYSRRPEVRKRKSKMMKRLIKEGKCGAGNPKFGPAISRAKKGKKPK